ncbi:MAG: hypothetical protein IJ925_01895 [Muribaculaceae bacterium]|nr:hypothetical protein [Muribaculaceae bacterium]
MDSSTQMNVPATTPQSSTATPSSAAAADAQEPASEPATCSKCGGSGKVSCSKCGGKGYIHKRLRGDDGDWSKDYGCSKCGGSGYRSSEGYDGEHLRKGSGKMKCPECHDTGKFKHNRELITISG